MILMILICWTTESDDDFNNELNHTLDYPELESLEKQLNKFNEQDVNKKLIFT
jgi:hypothetical protein